MPNRFRKVAIEPGTYYPRDETGKPFRVDITPARIQHWSDETKRLLGTGARIPVPYVHTDEAVPVMNGDPPPTSYNNAGHVVDVGVNRMGQLEFEIEPASPDDANKLINAIKDVSIRAKDFVTGMGDSFKDVITHVAAVNHPVWTRQPNFVPSTGLALSLWMSDPPEMNSQGREKNESSGNKLENVLSLLAEHGLELPEGTDEYSFLDNLLAALVAVRSYKNKEGGDEAVENPPAGSKRQQPSPIAMATDRELEFALNTLGPGTNPATGKPWTAVELKQAAAEPPVVPPAAAPPAEGELSLSAELQVNKLALQKMAKRSLIQRMQDMIEAKSLDPNVAEAKLVPAVNSMEIKFDLQGNEEPSWVHEFLDACEASGRGGALHGKTPSDLRAHAGQQFSLGDGLQVQRRPAGIDARENELTPEEAEALADRMLANIGLGGQK